MLDTLHLGPAPENGIQIVLPIIEKVEAGQNIEYCTWTDVIFDKDTDVKAAAGFQSPTGHHTVVFYTLDTQPPGTTRVCTEDDMATFRFAVGAGGEGNGQEAVAPGNLVYRIPQGAQLVVNHHYLNATTQDLPAQSAVNIRFADPSQDHVPAGSIVFLDTSLRIAPGEGQLDVTCKMQREVKLYQLFPHMHRWGKHVTVDHVKGDKVNRLFDLEWREDFTFHAPPIERDPADPFVLAPDDEIRIRCQWMNDTGKDLTFGPEMCVAFGQFVNDGGIENPQCNRGDWSTF